MVVDTSCSWCCSRSASPCPITLPNMRPSSSSSGSGPLSKNTVKMKSFSQVSAGADCRHDRLHSHPSALQPRIIVWRRHRLPLHEHRGNLRLPPADFQLQDQEREGPELHDDRDVVRGRPFQDNLLHFRGNRTLNSGPARAIRDVRSDPADHRHPDHPPDLQLQQERVFLHPGPAEGVIDQ